MTKIIFHGPVFNPTGISTANREIVKALTKMGVKVQCTDVFNNDWSCNEGLEYLNTAIVPDKDTVTIFADYPQFWRNGRGKLIGMFLHEGTKLPPHWSDIINTVDQFIVPSEATKNLFKWNDVVTPISVVNYGFDSNIYKPRVVEAKEKNSDYYCFLSVNSWTGKPKDRKGTDVLIKAFDEEFKDEKVKLLLKVSTFWEKQNLEYYVQAIHNILGHTNDNIIVNSEYMDEKDLVETYNFADCFVCPTRGEGFGLTPLNAMACGLPLIITKDKNSGHMDFCREKESVLWIDKGPMEQADQRFFAEGNMQPLIDLESLKKQLRFAYENRIELKEKALKVAQEIQSLSWEQTAKNIMEVINGKS